MELTKGDAVITWYKDKKEIRFSDHYQLSIDGKVRFHCQDKIRITAENHLREEVVTSNEKLARVSSNDDICQTKHTFL